MIALLFILLGVNIAFSVFLWVKYFGLVLDIQVLEEELHRHIEEEQIY